MPELPEVEVVKKSLENQICNLTVKDIKVKDINLRYKVKKHEFNKIIGLKILRIERRSKYFLVVPLEQTSLINFECIFKYFFTSSAKEGEVKKINIRHNSFI